MIYVLKTAYATDGAEVGYYVSIHTDDETPYVQPGRPWPTVARAQLEAEAEAGHRLDWRALDDDADPDTRWIADD
jgi:hypothetical protein